MQFENVSGNWDFATGTSLKGNVNTSFERLCEVFGDPTYGGDKTQAEWVLLFEDGTVATIYDWKESVPVQYVTDWHIGGKTNAVEELVNEALFV